MKLKLKKIFTFLAHVKNSIKKFGALIA